MDKLKDLLVSSGPLKRDKKWVTGRDVLSQVNQEAEAHGSNQLVWPPVSIERHLPTSHVLSYVLSLDYSAIFVVLSVHY